MKAITAKVFFLLCIIAAAFYCSYRGDQIYEKAHALSEEISTKRSKYVGDAAGSPADKVVKLLEDDRDTLIKQSAEMNHLFTFVMSGFLGLALSVASDLLGRSHEVTGALTQPPKPGNEQ